MGVVMLKIDKNVPMPRPDASPVAKYPWRDMEVGDSFFVAGKTMKQFAGIPGSASRKYGKKFSARSVEGGVRVWRVA